MIIRIHKPICPGSPVLGGVPPSASYNWTLLLFELRFRNSTWIYYDYHDFAANLFNLIGLVSCYPISTLLRSIPPGVRRYGGAVVHYCYVPLRSPKAALLLINAGEDEHVTFRRQRTSQHHAHEMAGSLLLLVYAAYIVSMKLACTASLEEFLGPDISLGLQREILDPSCSTDRRIPTCHGVPDPDSPDASSLDLAPFGFTDYSFAGGVGGCRLSGKTGSRGSRPITGFRPVSSSRLCHVRQNQPSNCYTYYSFRFIGCEDPDSHRAVYGLNPNWQYGPHPARMSLVGDASVHLHLRPSV
ncbi:hypothetical protein BDV11DRAFT_133546 [Aspergillus similis]